MDPQRWILPQANDLLDLASRSAVRSRSWITRLLFIIRVSSSRLRVRAKEAPFKAWPIFLLLPAVPAGFAIKYSNQTPAATVTVNLVAMVPLGAILTLLTDELIVKEGGHEALLVVITAGSLTSIFLKNEEYSYAYMISRNLVQLVVTVVALAKGSVDLVQTSLIGTVLSNLLLMVGTGIFLGGLDRYEQHFNRDAVSSLLNELFSIFGVFFILVAFQAWADGDQALKSARITTLSRAASVLFIVSYICYAVYSYKSHSSVFTSSHQKAKKWRIGSTAVDGESGIGLRLLAFISGTATDAEERTPHASFSRTALAIMVIVDTALLGLSTAFVCDSIDNLNQSGFGLSRTLIGLIVLPAVSCNLHAITLARRDQMLQSFTISISGSAQLLRLVLPFTVLVGWMLGNSNMNLLFDGFQAACVFISTVSLKYVTAGGKSNWYDMRQSPDTEIRIADIKLG